MHQPLKTFIIYAHEDREYKTGLEKFLRHLVRKKKIEIWSDREIKPGELWDETIQLNLGEAEVILMLVSVDFYNSDYIQDTEFAKAKAKFDNGEALLVPVLVRYCPWKSYDLIRDLQALPTGAKSVDTWFSKDEAFTDIAEKLESLMDGLLDSKKRKFEEEQLRMEAENAQKQAAAEAQKRATEAEKAEKIRHKHDETFWKKVLHELETGDDPVHKIALLNSYLESEANQNHRAEAEEHIEEIEAEMEATRKLAAAREKTEAERRQKEEAKLVAEKEAAEHHALFFKDMVLVEGGAFQMGGNMSDKEKPIHFVVLSGFYISKYLVTQDQWQKIMGSNPSRFQGDDNMPVESVSWDDVQEFLQKLNAKSRQRYRLPTEAEWEFAARGGNLSRGFMYAGGDVLDEVGWYSENSNNKTHPIGLKQPNELDLYDMSGNVWEWCADWYSNYSVSSKVNPTGPASGTTHVFRGGGWDGSQFSCRLTNRINWQPDSHYFPIGFRLAHSL